MNSENLLEKLRFQIGFSEFKLGEFAGKAMLPDASRKDSPSLNSENLLEKQWFQGGFSEFEFGEFVGKAMLPKRILRV